MSELLTDNFERRIADLEKRLARLERAAEKPATHLTPLNWRATGGTWCDCGRDVCRAPDCPSHKADPLGR